MQEEYQVLENVELIVAFEKNIQDSFSLWDKMKAKLVKLISRSDYFHTEIAINGYWYSFGQDGLSKRILKPLNDNYDYILINKTISQEQKKILDNLIESSTTYDYDWLAIFFTFTIKVGADESNGFTCGEFVTKVLQVLTVHEVTLKQAHKNSPETLCNDLKYSYEYLIK